MADDSEASGHYYSTSTTLYVVGDGLDPQRVTELFGIEPDHTRYKGQRSDRAEDGTTQTGTIESSNPGRGLWCRKIDVSIRDLSVEDQLEQWCTFLVERLKAVEELRKRGAELSLDCFMHEPWPVIMYLLPELVSKLNALSVPVKFTIYGNDSTP